jgi:hypothetical protein
MNMKKPAVLLVFVCFVFACHHQTADTPEELKLKLRKTMTEYLYKGKNNDSAHVKFQVTDVVYFEEASPPDYVCEFTVRLIENNKDTTGTMSARISKDMANVIRRY